LLHLAAEGVDAPDVVGCSGVGAYLARRRVAEEEVDRIRFTA
jgi:hypothetical protein